jgi:hypothetical protein
MTWVAVGGAAVSVVGGMISGKKAGKAQKQQAIRAQEAADANVVNEQNRYNVMTGYADQYRNQLNKPTYHQNSYGTSTIDPATGQTRFQLSGPYQGFRDQAFGQAQNSFDLANSMDPQQFANDRYKAAQSLLAAGDQSAESGLMQDLYNKGGFGLQTNRSAAPTVDANGQIVPGSGNVSVNPYVNTFMNARNDRNAGMAYGSLREGQSYLDTLLNRGRAAYGMGQGIDQLGVGSMDTAMRYRDTFNQDFKGMLGNYVGATDNLYKAYGDKLGVWGGQDVSFGSRNQAQQWQSGTDKMAGLPWDKVISGMSGMIGGAGASSPYDSIPSGVAM